MKKVERKELEKKTDYVVKHNHEPFSDTYDVSKYVSGELKDTFTVTLKWNRVEEPRVPVTVWCDCPGFKNQKFAHLDHKHVKVVSDFQRIERRCIGQKPEFARYRIRGTGAHTQIKRIHTEWSLI